MPDFDVIVLGTGAAGLTAAVTETELGAHVGLFEKGETLYAGGNAMSSPLGMTYGGAGGTLGPAVVFGFLAGRDIAQRVNPTSHQAATISPTALAAAHGGA